MACFRHPPGQEWWRFKKSSVTGRLSHGAERYTDIIPQESLRRTLHQCLVNQVFQQNGDPIFLLKSSTTYYSFDYDTNIFRHFSLIFVSNVTNDSTSESHN